VHRFVRDRLGEKHLEVAFQQVCIVVDSAVTSVRNTHLSSADPAQIEVDVRHCEFGVEMPRRQVMQLDG